MKTITKLTLWTFAAGLVAGSLFTLPGTAQTVPTTAVTQSGTWNLTNISGTVSLPTGAATAANQATIIGHVDGLETLIGTTNTSLSTIDGRVDGIEALLTTIDADTGNLAAIAASLSVLDDTGGEVADEYITVRLSDGTSFLSLAGDVVFGTATYTETTSSGPLVGAVRNDTLAALAGTDNEVAPLQVNALGALYTEAILSAVDNAVLDNIDADATTIIGHVDGIEALLTTIDADTGNILTSANFAAAFGTAGTADSQVMSVQGIASMTPLSMYDTANTTGGADAFSYISAGATEDEHAVKATAGTLFSVTATNTNAAVRYLKCENDTAANTAPGTDTPELRIAIPGSTTGAGFTTTFSKGWSFSTALTCWLVTGAADSDVAEVAANEIMVFYTYK